MDSSRSGGTGGQGETDRLQSLHAWMYLTSPVVVNNQCD